MAEHDILPSNSNKTKMLLERNRSEEPKIERKHATAIAKRDTTVVKEGAAKKFIKLFLAEDVDDVGKYLVEDLIIPGVKDVFFNFLWALFWGDRKVGGFGGKNDRVPYHKMGQSGKVRTMGSSMLKKKDEADAEETQQIKKFDVRNLRFASQAEAKEVLMAMKMYLEEYPSVPVGYLQELLDETGDWTSEYYGWTGLSEARIRPTSGGGWLLVLPPPERLER